MKVSKGQSQPQIVAAAFLVLHMVLGRPFFYRVLIVTQMAFNVVTWFPLTTKCLGYASHFAFRFESSVLNLHLSGPGQLRHVVRMGTWHPLEPASLWMPVRVLATGQSSGFILVFPPLGALVVISSTLLVFYKSASTKAASKLRASGCPYRTLPFEQCLGRSIANKQRRFHNWGPC